MRYEFEWDARKARSNLRKHGITFDLARLVFQDPLAIAVPDLRHDKRWVTIGDVDGRLLVVVHSDAETTNGEGRITTRVRIISARSATPRERRSYRSQR